MMDTIREWATVVIAALMLAVMIIVYRETLYRYFIKTRDHWISFGMSAATVIICVFAALQVEVTTGEGIWSLRLAWAITGAVTGWLGCYVFVIQSRRRTGEEMTEIERLEAELRAIQDRLAEVRRRDN